MIHLSDKERADLATVLMTAARALLPALPHTVSLEEIRPLLTAPAVQAWADTYDLIFPPFSWHFTGRTRYSHECVMPDAQLRVRMTSKGYTWLVQADGVVVQEGSTLPQAQKAAETAYLERGKQ